jgi:hypothetical protein
VLRTQPFAAGVDGPDGDALAGVDVGPATDALRGRRQQVTEVTSLLAAAETAAAAAAAAGTRAEDADRAAEGSTSSGVTPTAPGTRSGTSTSSTVRRG